ncbi:MULTISPECIES: hypothetical protein [unclassified Streptomyces]|uniref:hypothetical protein n=1 Tax=unclassified Streptomyces TaxID=2593676 RepID=UPI0036A92F4E
MSPRGLKILWVVIASLVSLVVALVAGILMSTTGTALAETVLYAGGVFGGSLVVLITVFGAVGLL